MSNNEANIVKEERFTRVAEKRTNAIIRSLRSLSNCANTRNYSYTDTQVRKIIKAIENEIDSLKKVFNTRAGQKKFEL